MKGKMQHQQYVLTRRNADGTSSTSFPILALSIDEVSRALSGSGFVRNRKGEKKGAIPKEVYSAILESNPRHAKMIRSGDTRFNLLEHQEFVNPNRGDLVDLTDYELQRVQTHRDPFVYVKEHVEGTTSAQVIDIIVHELKKKFVRVVYSEGARSKRAKRCVIEVAMLANLGVEHALQECMDMVQLVEGKLGPKAVQTQPQVPHYWTERPYDKSPNTVQPNSYQLDVQNAQVQIQQMMQEYQRMSQQVSEIMAQMQTTLNRAMEVYERRMVHAH